MDFFSHESHLAVVIDPQMFTSSPGTPAGVGRQGVSHVAGFAPVREDASPSTPLFNADGVALGVTLGAWEQGRPRGVPWDDRRHPTQQPDRRRARQDLTTQASSRVK